MGFSKPHIHLKWTRAVLFMALFGLIGGTILYLTFAATPIDNAIEPETDLLSGNSSLGSDVNASGGKYVNFFSPSPPPTSGYSFPLHVTADGHHLADMNNKPFIVVGDAAWSLEVGPDKNGVAQYLNDRQTKGFTTILMEVMEHKFDTHGAPKNAYGDVPFTSPGDFGTPNEAYFAHLDYVIQQASQRNMAVFLTPDYLGYPGTDEGWYNETVATSAAKMRTYGQFLGNRYKAYGNIVWVLGGDSPPLAALQQIKAIVQGLQETIGGQPIFTVHNSRQQSGITQYPGESWINLNTTYGDCTTSPQLLSSDYARSPALPTLLFEGWYEGEHATSAICIRSQAYWSVLLGGIGHIYGNYPIWNFDPGWQANLNTQGANDMTRFAKLFNSRNWSSLVPDTTHTTLTSGYGSISNGSYAAAARTTNGNTVIIYSPSQAGLTINMTRISGSQAHARWFNPSNGNVTDIGTFATSGTKVFTPPTNSDWVLVIDDASLNLGAPGS